MKMRTSVTHPLRIDEIRIEDLAGVIGLTFCPGKTQKDGWTGAWQRSLDLDLAAIKKWGSDAVVTLMESKELDLYDVRNLPNKVQGLGMVWIHLPIQDETAPTKQFDLAWRTEGKALVERLISGQRILLHCKGGLGRTGTVAAKLLTELGFSADDAIAIVRNARSDTIDVGQQENYVRKQISSTWLKLDYRK
ncbi:MAG: cyclin-dependent kinase inhibitor 3 family protein [Armatimonadota bacterium]